MNNVKLLYKNLYKKIDYELDDIDIKSVLSSSCVLC